MSKNYCGCFFDSADSQVKPERVINLYRYVADKFGPNGGCPALLITPMSGLSVMVQNADRKSAIILDAYAETPMRELKKTISSRELQIGQNVFPSLYSDYWSPNANYYLLYKIAIATCEYLNIDMPFMFITDLRSQIEGYCSVIRNTELTTVRLNTGAMPFLRIMFNLIHELRHAWQCTSKLPIFTDDNYCEMIETRKENGLIDYLTHPREVDANAFARWVMLSYGLPSKDVEEIFAPDTDLEEVNQMFSGMKPVDLRPFMKYISNEI